MRAAALLAAGTALLSGCGGGGGSSAPGPPRVVASATPKATPKPTPSPKPTPTPFGTPTPTPPPNDHQIAHVVIIVQENRSFDNLFYGFPGADTATEGQDHNGNTVQLKPWGLENQGNLGHQRSDFDTEYNAGKMNGFDLEYTIGSKLPADFAYSYVPPAETTNYLTLAQRYVVGDRMFQSNSSDSYPAHQYLIAAQSANVLSINGPTPWGCDAPLGTTTLVALANNQTGHGPFPCFSYPTLATLADGAGIPWRYYVPSLNQPGGALWSAFDAIKPVRYGSEWTTNVISPETTVLNDIPAGKLGAVTWVIPSFTNSDHPESMSTTGPDWVASVVNAVGTSKFWNSTAIFVVWDDWGGWYDHVPPPRPPGTPATDYVGPGFRVPFLAISPYSKHGYVSHVVYEYGSILRFAEWAFNLPSLGQEDAWANPLFDCFDFSQAPQKYQPLAVRRRADYFLNAKPDHRLPDER